jgi:uncharacterized membrane protein YfcA
MEQNLVLILVFLLVSILFSMLGLGGGILYVPILFFAGFGMTEAPGISLVLIMATSLAALFTFLENRKVDWKLAMVIDPPTDIMAFVGGYCNALIPESVLHSLLVIVLLIAGTLMLRNTRIGTVPDSVDNHWWRWQRNFKGKYYSVNLPLVLMATALIGLVSGMLGITGGIIKLPIMVLLCGVPMDIAVATSTVMVAATAISGLVGHAINGQVDWKVGLLLAGAAVVGGFLGSRISISMDKSRLKRWFGIVVYMVALRMISQLIW